MSLQKKSCLKYPKKPSFLKKIIFDLMRKAAKRLLHVLIFSFLAHFSAHAGGNEMRFRRLSIEHGLSQSAVFAILEDSKGYLWVATGDGLNRYDGYEFIVFKHEPNNPNSIPGNDVVALCEDPKGNIWIGTKNSGLVKYVPSEQKFIRYIKDNNNFKGPLSKAITALYSDSKGRIWVGTRDAGLSYFDPKTDKFTNFKYRYANPNSISSNHITSIAEDRKGRIWIGTPGFGVSCIDLLSGKISRSFFTDGDSTDIMSPEIAGFFHLPDEHESLHCLDINGRFFRLNAERKVYREVYHWASNQIENEPATVQTILVDRFGKIWVGGSNSGLYMINPSTKEVKHAVSNPRDPYSLSINFVSSIYQDRSGLVWIGTNGGGINVYNPRSAQFHNYTRNPFDPESLPDNDIWAISSSGSDLLIGTSSYGLVQLDPKSGRSSVFQPKEKPFDPSGASYVYDVQILKSGDIWVATNGDGIHVYGPNRKWKYALRHDPENPNSLMGNSIRSIHQDSSGIVWVAVKDKGLNRINLETGEFRKYRHQAGDKSSLSNAAIMDLLMDPRGRLIIGHSSGIDIMDTATEIFAHFSRNPQKPFSLGNDDVISLFIDKNKLLWIGTSGGINVMHPETNKFVMLDEAGGLPNGMIYAIAQDKKGNLWFSTNEGICRITPPGPDILKAQPGRFLLELKQSIRNYDISEGINSNEFNSNAVFSHPDGTIFFGGIGGISSFHPDSLQDNFLEPRVYVSSFKVLGNDFVIPSAASKITLRHNQNYIAFDFIAINLLNAQLTQYAYMLEGFDKDWIYSGKRRFASYTNLEPGDYVFKIKATANNGNWSGKIYTLRFTIQKPFWKEPWFYFIAIAASLGLAWLLLFLRERKLNSDKQELEREVEQRTHELRLAKEQAENSMKAKEMFLSTMSHEIRTPLNAVIAMGHLLMEEDPRPEQVENLQTLKFSSENLLVLINDILDFSKIDAGKIEFEEVPMNIRDLVKGLRKALYPVAIEKKIDLITFVEDEVPQTVLGDPVRLNQVLTNLVSNGLKFTISGSVKLEVRLESANDQQCEIAFVITDTGIGIAKDKFEQIFESFEQASKDTTRKFGGTGLGLTITKRLLELQGSQIQLESEFGKGSKFFFNLKFKRARGQVSMGITELVPDEQLLKGLRILLVEDNSVNRLIATKFLEKWGASISYAENGLIGVEKAASEAFDVILMDLQMPEMDGFEATRNIRKMGTPRAIKVPILALTAAAMVEVKDQVMKAGMNDYIAKPFNPEDLFSKIARHSGRMS